VRAERPSRREPGNRPAAPARGDGGRDRGDHGRRGHKGRDEQGRKVGPVLILCAVGAVIAVAAGIWFLAR
jgi:hypothetical protein